MLVGQGPVLELLQSVILLPKSKEQFLDLGKAMLATWILSLLASKLITSVPVTGFGYIPFS